MKTIKILGIFLFQKLKEIGQILIGKQNWRTPGSVILWVRTLVYIPGIIFSFYWWVKLVWYILSLFGVTSTTNHADYFMVPLAVLFGSAITVFLFGAFYAFYLSEVVTDFKRWFSSNWDEAKRKVEDKK